MWGSVPPRIINRKNDRKIIGVPTISYIDPRRSLYKTNKPASIRVTQRELNLTSDDKES